jgi:hypothetical protein
MIGERLGSDELARESLLGGPPQPALVGYYWRRTR